MKSTFFLFITAILTVFSSINEASEASQKFLNEEIKNYLDNRLEASDKRYESFALALQMMEQRHAQVLVETGTSRDADRNFAGDGGSTIIFANWAAQHNAKLYSVDIDPQAVLNAEIAVQNYAENVEVFLNDSVDFLTNFNELIDFLYLDSYDFNVNDPLPSQMHHLKEIEAAYSKLHDNSIVMIDDCDLPLGGKGKLVIPYLQEKGWKIVYNGYQVILSR